MMCLWPLFLMVMEVWNNPDLQVSHLASEWQGQNPGEVSMFVFVGVSMIDGF